MTTTDVGRVKRALSGDASLLVTRAVLLDDIHIRAGGTGRDVVAYAAVWMSPTEIVDGDGHYREQNAPDSFDKSINERAGRIFSVYNHAKTLGGTPSDMWSVPLGKPIEIRADKKGLLTVTRYPKDDPVVERIFQAIKDGRLTGMSYTGVFLRSDPPRSRYGLYGPDSNGNLTLVTRLETALIEYGPTPNPAYLDAEIIGIRSRKANQVDEPERETITVTTTSSTATNTGNVTVTAGNLTATNPGGTRIVVAGQGTEAGRTADTTGDATDDTTTDSATADSADSAVDTGITEPPEPSDRGDKRKKKDDHDDPDVDNSHNRAMVDNSPWDGNAAMTAAHSGSDYASICAGRKDGPADERSSWALPHHARPGAPPNAAGVRNALARLSQTEGLTNREAARRHLEAHLATIQNQNDNSKTSSSGRQPAPGAERIEPHLHSATHHEEGDSMDTDRQTLTVEERVARQSEIRARFNEIDTQYSGAELPQEARAEWAALQEELVEHERAIADATQRAEYLRYINDTNPGAVERVDNDQAGYGQRGVADGGHLRPATSRWGAGPALHVRDNIYDLAAIRNKARHIDEIPLLYRDYAMRAVDQARFPSANGRYGAPNREQAQERVQYLLDTIDDEHGTLARRILVTGSPLYDKAFGKMLGHQSVTGLTAEESRALALGTDSAGGYAVPFQLDPTVLLTSNGVVNPLRQISRVETITGKEWDGVTSAGVTVTRGTEGQEVGTGDPAFGQPSVRTTRVQGWIPFSIELDVSWNALRTQLTRLLMDAKDVEEATSFATGNGTAPNPNGVVTTLGTASRVDTAGSGALAAGDIYLLENAMAPRFIANSSIVASKTIYNKFRTLFQAQASAAGDPFARPSGAMGERFNGYPKYELSTMATTTGTGDLVMLQGDFQQFLIVDRVGMGIELVPHVLGSNRRPTGERGVIAIWFNNSKVLVDNAFRLLRVKAT